jgi:hypothetical protein
VALDDSVELGTVTPGNPVTASFRIQLDAAIGDQTRLEFTVPFRSTSGAPLGSDVVARVVAAPRLAVVETQAATVGVTTTFTLVVKNFGNGAAPSATGTLTSNDPDVTIVQGATTLAAVPSFGSAATAVPFVVTEATLAQRNRLHCALTDTRGRVLGFDFDLRAPAAAAKPSLDASEGPTVMRLAWDAVRRCRYSWATTSIDGRRAAVLWCGSRPMRCARRFSRTPVCNRARATTGRSRRSTARVSSGRRPPSRPAAPTRRNWPAGRCSCRRPRPAALRSVTSMATASARSSSATPASTRGNANGVELRDGDADPLTWGALTSDAAVVTGAIALGELDPARPGLEIVRANWADSRVSVYDSQGSLLPGWPRQPANGTPGYWGTPVAADCDGDGRCEVLVIGKDGRLYGWHHDGTPLAGSDGTLATVGGFTRTAPAVANLDGDPQLEIVVAGADGFVRALEMNGTPIVLPVTSGWPRTLGGPSLSSPAIAEIDGNAATPEIVVTSENDQVHVLNARGFELPGWRRRRRWTRRASVRHRRSAI